MHPPVDRQHLDPDLIHRLGRLDLIARAIIQGVQQGAHRSRRRGFSTEFSDFNPYVPGDDLRLLDWRLYARTERLFVRTFQAETNLEVMLLLDASASMAWRWAATLNKLEYAANLLAALAALHVRQRDQVGLLLHDARAIHHLPPRCRRTQLDAIFATLEAIVPAVGDTLPALLQTTAAVRRHRGRLVLCSDLEEEPDQLLPALAALAGQQDEIIVLHLLDAAEEALPFTGATHLRDSETGELLPIHLARLQQEHPAQVAAFRRFWEEACTGLGLHYLPLHTASSYVDVILALAEALQQRR